jgi:hypothetical protein
MCSLVSIMKKMLKFELTIIEVDNLEEEMVKWVELYEK